MERIILGIRDGAKYAKDYMVYNSPTIGHESVRDFIDNKKAE